MNDVPESDIIIELSSQIVTVAYKYRKENPELSLKQLVIQLLKK